MNVYDQVATHWVQDLSDAEGGLARLGGKGASLARLASAELPVPPGFVLTTDAYRAFVDRAGLGPVIGGALDGLDGTDPGAVEAAARDIGAAFAAAEPGEDVVATIAAAYAELGGGTDVPVAVRSSATAEDLPNLSFAGQQETFLNVRGVEAVVDAVRRCWASLWTARAIGYRARNGVPTDDLTDDATDDVALAVVVQELVDADAAGVLFTADPVTGAADRITLNAAWGLGEAVVGGQVSADTMIVDRATMRVAERVLADKSVMTVRTAEGTEEVEVPADRRERPAVSDQQAVGLAELGVRIEGVYDRPMDLEWARRGDELFVLQARPITTSGAGAEPARPAEGMETWNDTLSGDYLWTCANLGEAIPSVMTPATWSLVRIFMSEAMPLEEIGGHHISGNVGGRFYLNLSVMMGAVGALGVTGFVRRNLDQAFGEIPAEAAIPRLPMSTVAVFGDLAPRIVRFLRGVLPCLRDFDRLIGELPARIAAFRAEVARTSTPAALAELWDRDGERLLRHASRMLAAGARRNGVGITTLRPKLARLVGDSDAGAMLTHAQSEGDTLASLGPVLGLGQVARGELDRDAYARRWGHRCPDEFEISVPRPAEDPAWIDRQLAGIRDAGREVDELVAAQHRVGEEAWARFAERYPGRVTALRNRARRAARAFRGREEARSEVIRTFWALREFALRAGELTGHGEDVFFLSIQELGAVLRGDETPLADVPARRASYAAYAALPTYPTLIRGGFDPFAWAADPARRTDIYDATREHAPVPSLVSGFAGAAGVVEGTARVLAGVEDGDELCPGDILVTSVTNIGWTPLFPRAGAVVTDIGAPLSHAAIVARELGIPAVVGCRNATTRLRSGDRVRVDGGRGTVELLESATS